jgi:hypothetical protein
LPVDKRREVVELLSHQNEHFFPVLGPCRLQCDDANFKVNILKYFGLFADIKSTHCIEIFFGYLVPKIIGGKRSELLDGGSLRVVESCEHCHTHLMCVRFLLASFEVSLQERHCLLRKDKPVSIETIHLLGYLYEDLYLARLSKEAKLSELI